MSRKKMALSVLCLAPSLSLSTLAANPPNKRQSAAGHINVTSYNPQPYDTAGGFVLAATAITEEFSGGLVGTGSSRLILVTESVTGTVRFTGVEKFTGKLGNTSGSFLFENTGTLKDGRLESTWRIIPGSATGGLKGLLGEGGCTPKGYQLHYWFQ
jgi:uncharacterized protein DUF3224